MRGCCLETGPILASDMSSLCWQRELGQLQAGQQAAEILGQHPSSECWCCGAWRVQAWCQVLSHSVNTQTGVHGADDATCSPLQAIWWLLLFRKKKGGLKRWWEVQVRVVSSVTNSLGIKVIIRPSQETVERPEKQRLCCSKGSILQTLLGSLLRSLVGSFLLLPLCCVSGYVSLQKVQSTCSFLSECPLTI